MADHNSRGYKTQNPRWEQQSPPEQPPRPPRWAKPPTPPGSPTASTDSFLVNNTLSIPGEQLSDCEWLVPNCTNADEASAILSHCETIANGNFLVRPSQKSDSKYTITFWMNGKPTNVRIKQLPNGQFQVGYKPTYHTEYPIFDTLKDLIHHYSNEDMKLIGHCQGTIKLKYNPNVFEYLRSAGGIETYGTD